MVPSFKSFVCRTCLIETREITSLNKVITLDGNVIKLSEILFVCSSLEINPENDTSEVICKNCIRKLSKAYCFRQQCLEADLFIKESQYLLEKSHNVASVFLDETEQVLTEEEEELLELESPSAVVCMFGNEVEEDVCISEDEIEKLETFLSAKSSPKLPLNHATKHWLPKIKNHRRPKIADDGTFKSVLRSPTHKKCSVPNIEWLCSHCGTIFDAKHKLDRHTIIHHEPGNFKCASCDKQFKTKSHLKQHMRLHNPDNKFKCEICNELFMGKSYLDIHNRRKHTKEMKHFCSICGKGTINSYDMKVHMVFHTNVKGYTCTQCNAKFFTSSHLSDHLKVQHATEANEEECNICNKKFTARKQLRRHLETHTRKQCTLCPKSFTLNKFLLMHMLEHTGESLSVCETCGKKFVKKVDYTNHVNLKRCKPKV